MSKEFNIYKWKRDIISENISNEVIADKIYSYIKKYLSKDYQDVGYKRFITSAIIRAMSLNEEIKDKVSPDELFNNFKHITVKGAGSHFPQENTIKVAQRYAPDDEEAKSFFTQNGYEVDIKNVEGEPGERVDMIWYIYK